MCVRPIFFVEVLIEERVGVDIMKPLYTIYSICKAFGVLSGAHFALRVSGSPRVALMNEVNESEVWWSCTNQSRILGSSIPSAPTNNALKNQQEYK